MTKFFLLLISIIKILLPYFLFFDNWMIGPINRILKDRIMWKIFIDEIHLSLFFSILSLDYKKYPDLNLYFQFPSIRIYNSKIMFILLFLWLWKISEKYFNLSVSHPLFLTSIHLTLLYQRRNVCYYLFFVCKKCL